MNRPMRNISDSVILQEFKTLRDTIEKRFDEQDELNKMWFHVLGEQTVQTNKALKSKDGNSGASEMALDGIAEVFSVVLNNQNVLLKAKTESDRRIAEMQAELKALQSQNEKLQNTLDVYHSQSKTKSEIVDAELTKLHRLGCIMLALVVFIAIITCYFLLDVAH